MITSKENADKTVHYPAPLRIFIIIIILILIPSSANIYFTWTNAVKETERKAIQLAQAVEGGIQKSHIMNLKADLTDLGKDEYNELKNSLIAIAKLNSDIRFSYVMVKKGKSIYFLADSEPADSEDYSPPGQLFYEADPEIFLAFESGKTFVTKPTSDRWGTWVSVLVPMKEYKTGKVVAIFGIDFPASRWNNFALTQTLRSAALNMCFILLILALVLAYKRGNQLNEDKKRLEKLDSRLRENEALFRAVVDQAPIGIAIENKRNGLIKVNPVFEEILGRTKDELSSLSWMEFTHPDDLKKELEHIKNFNPGKEKHVAEKRFIRPDGSVVWVNLMIAPLTTINPDSDEDIHILLLENITERKNNEIELRKIEKSKAVLLSSIPGMAYRCSYDEHWTMQFVSDKCYDLTGYKPESILNNRDISFNDIIAPEYRSFLWNEWKHILKENRSMNEVYEIITATGKRKWVLEMGQGVRDENGRIEALEGVIIDISEQKDGEAKIQYMIDHDYLTGLYNRRYFEKALKSMDNEACLPLSVMDVDINGVRLINDAFGYAEGDLLIKNCAEIIKSCCRPGDIIARVGGDEFCLALPGTDGDASYDMLKNILKACEDFNNQSSKAYDINLSIGFATKEKIDENIDDVTKAADEYLRNQKLLNRNSFHSEIISSIMATVYEKSQETEEHATRLAEISKTIARQLNVPQKFIDELELFSMLHDIGKIGIDDSILKKPGSLSPEEWTIMKTHCEIGYRIAKSVSDIEVIADYILTHHERWDGKGYPRNLSGSDIPLLSRILAVADAYDAMTNDRVYRKALSRVEAVAEIKKNSGSQFDPEVVDAFLKIIENEKEMDFVLN